MSRKRSASGRRKRGAVAEGNDLLYHYFQKILLTEDAEQFRLLTTRLVVALGVWLPPTAYQRYPVLVPFAVRDPTCRGSIRHGRPDQWGGADAEGQFRDDNSLVKGVPKSLPVQNSNNELLHGKRLGTSFVASHVWRKLADGTDGPRRRVTYSFLPNLVWLPSQLSKLSDREGSWVQTYLQALAVQVYRDLPLAPALQTIVTPIWAQLPLRSEARGLALPDADSLNYFTFDEGWLSRRIRTLTSVVRALEEVSDGRRPEGKVVATRYAPALAELPPSDVEALRRDLTGYLQAVAQ